MKKLLALVLALVMVVGLAACSGKTEEKSDQLTVVISYEPGSLDGLDYGFIEYRNMFGIYEGLTTFGEGNDRPGQLAESIDVSDDGLVYTFTLREGIKFHNGETLTVDDVKYSLERFHELAGEGYGLDIVADYTYESNKIILTLSIPYAGFLDVLAYVPIVNQKAVEDGGEGYARAPIGTGPYKFVEWKQAQYIETTRFDDYWGEAAGIEKVTYRIIPEKSTALASLEKGEVDIVLGVPAAEVERINKLNDITVQTTDSNKQLYYFLHTERIPKPVRQAISMAIDREAVIELVESGRGHIPTSHIEGRIGDIGETYDYTRNVEGAKKLLAESGNEGFTLTLLQNASDDMKVAQMIQNSLRDVGITLEIENVEAGAFWDRVAASDFDMYGRTANLALPDAVDYVMAFESTATANRTKLNNPEMDAAVQAVLSLPDGDERNEQLKITMDVTYEECQLTPVYIGETNVAYRSNLKGISVSRIDFYNLAKLSW